MYHMFKNLMVIAVLLLLCFSNVFSQSWQTILYDDFNDLSSWSNYTGNCPGFNPASDGDFLYVATYGSCSPGGDQWEGIEQVLPEPITPDQDFVVSFKPVVLTDFWGQMGGVMLFCLNDANEIVASMNWYEPQAATGFAGVSFFTEGPPSDANDIYGNFSGFDTEFPTINDVMEIRRIGNIWSAWVSGVQKGSDFILTPSMAITKVRITFYNFVNWAERDIKVDFVSFLVGSGTPILGKVLVVAEGAYDDINVLDSLITVNGFIPDFRDYVPFDLSPYCLFILTKQSVANPSLSPLLRNFISNGGGFITSGGHPFYLAGSTNLSIISDWFGASYYVNSNGASVLQVDDPLGSGLPIGTIIFNDNINPCNYGASVTGLISTATEIAHWEQRCSPLTTAFTNEYGNGRVYYSQDLYNFGPFGKDEMLNMTSAAIRWCGVNCPISLLTVNLDIKPRKCPNIIKIKNDDDGDDDNGKLVKAAILGTDDFDVNAINPTSVQLEGVPPSQPWKIKDKSRPVNDITTCACTDEGKDGFDDLILKFSQGALLDAISPVNDGEDEIELSLTGELYDGTPFEGSDCVVILIKGDDDDDGACKSLVAKENELPSVFTLSQNYPNPFNPTTEIMFSLPEVSDVTLVIYNVNGQKVATLISGKEYEAGYHSVEWDAGDYASGLYFYRIQAGEFVETKKMMLLK